MDGIKINPSCGWMMSFQQKLNQSYLIHAMIPMMSKKLTVRMMIKDFQILTNNKFSLCYFHVHSSFDESFVFFEISLKFVLNLGSNCS